MRLQNYVITEGRSKVIDLKEATDKIKKECSISYKLYKEGKSIFRGTSEIDEALFINPSNFERRSRNTTNLYTWVIDNSSKWKSFPKRGKSIICSFSSSMSAGYGRSTYYVFPKDGSNYGICPSIDIWYSFSKTIGDNSITLFNAIMDDVLIEAGMNPLSTTYNYNDFVKSMKELDIKVSVNKELFNMLDDSIIDNWQGSILKTLEVLFDPNTNGFIQTKNLSKASSFFNKNNELWTDGDSYMINWRTLRFHPERVDL